MALPEITGSEGDLRESDYGGDFRRFEQASAIAVLAIFGIKASSNGSGRIVGDGRSVTTKRNQEYRSLRPHVMHDLTAGWGSATSRNRR